MIELKKNMTILFQGDSITDAGRSREDDSFLGMGYPMMVSAILLAKYPQLNLKCVNKGVSGDRVCNLQERWQEDTLDYKPDLVSIMIGVNDMWRRYDSNDPTSAQAFEDGFRDVLNQTVAVKDVKILIIEPFLNIVREEMNSWKTDDLLAKIAVCQKLAKEFNTEYIPTETIMQEACKVASPEYWTADGVHPTMAGHALITEHYLKLLGVSIK